jgi:tetratricopeptide (TPR) repeat protein
VKRRFPVDASGLRKRSGSRVPGTGLLLIILLLILPCRGAGTNSNPVAEFDAAARLYEQGQYRAAAEAYGNLLAQGRTSAALHFNLGNAWFKAGEPGRAILNYRLAERLTPRDPDIRANLRMTRELVAGGSPVSEAAWRRWTRKLTLNEWAGFTAAMVWLCFGALTWGELRSARSSGPRRLAISAGVAVAVSGTFLASAWQDRRAASEAVVLVHEAVVRYGPLEVSPELSKVVGGAELTVLDRKDGWLQVSGIPRGPGWIPERDVAVLPP